VSVESRFAYVDSSALVKLVIPEAESAALRSELAGWQRHVCSALARTEVVRACARVEPSARGVAERVVAALDLIAVDDAILEDAARLEPTALRTLDAIHLASALALGEALGAVVTYDTRLEAGARAAGVATVTPR